jgi:uncharacterized protein
MVAGFLGALTGLGGGVIITPLLTLVFGVDIRYAIGASLVAIIATSSGAASSFVSQGFTNIRVGMLLEVPTTLGALGGAFLASYLGADWLATVFGAVLILSMLVSNRPQRPHPSGPPDRLSLRLGLPSVCPTPAGRVPYDVSHVPLGAGVMLGAGLLSGMLGIGAGAFKVLAMDQIMRLPFKVSTTTSNFMIGVTAAASAGVYLSRGYIQPAIVLAVLLGALPGALLGARVLVRSANRTLRIVFSLVIVAVGVQMIIKGVTGGG